MRYFRYKTGICIIVLAMIFASCDSWLEVKPIDKMNEEQMYENEEGFLTALNGIYLGMVERNLYGENLSCGFIEALAQNYNVSESGHKFYKAGSYDYTDKDKVKPYMEAIWKKAYFLIANCNLLLEKTIGKSEVLTPEHARLIKGEALGLRAYLHFDMFRLWGPMYDDTQKEFISIPYYTQQTTLPGNLLKAEDVFTHILTDLDSAEVLLQNDPVTVYGRTSGGDLLTANRHLRMNYYAVKALKARVYLWQGNKTEAYKCASELLEDTKFKGFFPFIEESAVNEAKDPDRFFYSEQLFCMQNLLRDKLYTDLFDPQLGDNEYLAPSRNAVIDLFSYNDDYRYKLMWRWNTAGGKAVAFAKYESISDNNKPIRTKIMGLIRLAELYLIAAETAPTPLEQVSYLNQFRLHRGYAANSVSISDDLPSIIRDEYHREFYGEGQYFYFMKRTKIDNWDGKELGALQYVLPLPDSESKYRK